MNSEANDAEICIDGMQMMCGSRLVQFGGNNVLDSDDNTVHSTQRNKRANGLKEYSI